MHNDPKDKDRHPDYESVPTPDENPIAEQLDEMGEKDPDELVHSIHVEEMPANVEIDADDAVHKSVPQPEPLQDTEQDPDDLVHGS